MINIYRVKINEHFRIFDETVLVLDQSLRDLEYEVTCNDYYKQGVVNILCGSTLSAVRLAERLGGKKYALYQLEQLDSKIGHIKDYPNYLKILRNAHTVLDYSPSNVKYLESMGIKALYLPPAYHPCLTTFPELTKDIDVLVFGTPTDRRLDLCKKLKEKMNAVFVVGYGEERNKLISRAKIVLNIHAFDNLNTLETIRLQLLLANKCFVISETSDHNPYGDGVVYDDYDKLYDLCVDYLWKDSLRSKTAERGFNVLKQTLFTQNLRPVMEKLLDNYKLACIAN